MRPYQGKLHVFPDAASLYQGAAEFITGAALASNSVFHAALSGGSTPKPLYQLLATPEFAARFPWNRAGFWLGDERFVSWADPASNWGMMRAALFDHVPVPDANLNPVAAPFALGGGETIEQAASVYEASLRHAYGATAIEPGRPLFDLNLLGLGADGHTASLLPGQDVLSVTDRWVAICAHGRAEERITLTYPALNASRTVMFLVQGEGKRAIVDHILSGAMDVPAAQLDVMGEVHWFLDQAAAGNRVST
jgi:6-phosphogluconolactonase